MLQEPGLNFGNLGSDFEEEGEGTKVIRQRWF